MNPWHVLLLQVMGRWKAVHVMVHASRSRLRHCLLHWRLWTSFIDVKNEMAVVEACPQDLSLSGCMQPLRASLHAGEAAPGAGVMSLCAAALACRSQICRRAAYFVVGFEEAQL